MTDTLYAFEAANGAVALYRDPGQRSHAATIFDGSQVGEYFTFNDGWSAVNYHVVRAQPQSTEVTK
jgi:hypothetical protein